MYSIALIGDVMLGRLVNDFLKSADPCYVWGDTKQLISNCDLAICNLECVIANKGTPWRKTLKVFHFRSDAKNIAALDCVGIGAVTLANNHALDYGYSAMAEMIGSLDTHNIKHAGAGQTQDDVAQPAIINLGTNKVGLLSFTDDMPEWAPTDGPGIYYVPAIPFGPEWQQLFDRVAQAKTKCDFLIVSPHWGPNWGYQTESIYADWAHQLIDCGADMVFGHSGHVPRGIEIYKRKPIIYSAGNFIDDYAIDPNEPNDEGFIYILQLLDNDKPTALRLYPTIISKFQAVVAGDRAPGIIYRHIRLSEQLGTIAHHDTKAQTVTYPLNSFNQ